MSTPTRKSTPAFKVVNRDNIQVSSADSSEPLYFVALSRTEVDPVLEFLEELRNKTSGDGSNASNTSVNRPRKSRESLRPPSASGSEEPFTEWDESVLSFLVMGLVHQILKDTPLEACDDVKGIITLLSERLMTEIAPSDIVIKPTGSDVVSLVKAVHKKLCKNSGGKRVLAILLLMEDSSLFDQIIAVLKKHLRTPQQSGFKRFVNAVTKPFTACFSGSSH